MGSPVDPDYSQGCLSLSNFTSLPCFNIKWGRQKHLRCVKDSHDDHGFSTSFTRSEFNSVVGFHHGKRRRLTDNDDGGIKAMGEKLMLDLRRQAEQMQAAFFNKSDVVLTVPHAVDVEVAGDSRPWNLRTRRAVCKDPDKNNNVPLLSDRKPRVSRTNVTEVKSPAKRNNDDANGRGDGDGNEGWRAKFSVSLSKKEIEEDFLAIMGTRPVRRPKKRPKIVQRQIDEIFPGYWLSEITADKYKVKEQHT